MIQMLTAPYCIIYAIAILVTSSQICHIKTFWGAESNASFVINMTDLDYARLPNIRSKWHFLQSTIEDKFNEIIHAMIIRLRSSTRKEKATAILLAALNRAISLTPNRITTSQIYPKLMKFLERILH